MRKTKRLLAFLFTLATAVLCIPLLSLDAAAANIGGSSGNQTVVTCFYAQTGENMPRRQYGASSLLTNSIKDVEGKGIAMM